jgi:hypothetical protein
MSLKLKRFIMQHNKVIIIGGGMAGINAALKLKELGKDFCMITEALGGRVKYSKERGVNLGAYFVINNYKNAKKILKKEKWLNIVDASFIEDGNNQFQTASITMISLIPQVLRFVLALVRFGSHYRRFKRNCSHMTHIEALKTDTYLSELSRQSSSDFIAKRKLQKLADAMIFKFAYACTLTPAEKLSAFDMMTTCQGILIPMFKFSFDEEGMAARLSGELVRDRVVGIEEKGGMYEIKTAHDAVFTADHLILATPADVTQELLGLQKIRKQSSAYVFHLKGDIIEKYGRHAMNLFSSKFDISSITKECNDTFLVFSRKRDTDLSVYFKKWEIIGKAEWDTALFVGDNYLLEQKYSENITIAGDHNSCGLEPACIAGLYAANRVLEKAYGRKIRKETHPMRKVILGLLVVTVLFILAYLPVISPFLSSRGSTDSEMSMSLPGDDLFMPGHKINMTQSVTVNATPDRIWPWMVQIGQDKAGFYSFEKLERLFGFGIHNTYRIVPEWQDLKAGDFVKFHRNGIGMYVHSVRKGKYFVLFTDSRKRHIQVPGEKVEFLPPLPGNMYIAWNWSFNLIPLPEGKTRLTVRALADWTDSNFVVNWLFHFGSEITGCVMNWQMINELKQCSEGKQDAIKIHL